MHLLTLPWCLLLLQEQQQPHQHQHQHQQLPGARMLFLTRRSGRWLKDTLQPAGCVNSE